MNDMKTLDYVFNGCTYTLDEQGSVTLKSGTPTRRDYASQRAQGRRMAVILNRKQNAHLWDGIPKPRIAEYIGV